MCAGTVDFRPKAGAYTLIHQPVMRLVGGWAFERRNPTTIPLLGFLPSVADVGVGFRWHIAKPLFFSFFHSFL